MKPRSIAASSELDQLAINTIRFLAVDMVEAGKSGHPGAPLGQAPMAYVLWSKYLRHDPANPDWFGRDRFVLSCGHASALLYALLHLYGYGLPVEELRRFRQLGSKTPGHPERELTKGVETTTGPLGQGLGNAVGMAMGREMLAARFNRPGFPLVDWRVWAFASDGDMMEGVASEACSLAGHLRLGALNVLYDDNHISIDGSTELAFTEDVGARFAAYGWHVQRVGDGNDLAALDEAMAAAEAETERPSLIVVRTVIGYGAPKKAGTKEAHGEPLGPEETRATKENLGWPLEPTFLVPDEARPVFDAAASAGAERARRWRDLLGRYSKPYPTEAADLERRLAGRLPQDWGSGLPDFDGQEPEIATREASGKVLNALAAALPELVGGSADLTPSTKTQPKGSEDFSARNRAGRHLRFGVREHGMGSTMNGLALTGALIPYGGTFLIFSDYMRPPIRLAALMGLGPIYVFTHDSIFLGEDGPTHQPVEQLAALRAIPGIAVLRPADACETVEAWRVAIERRHRPTALALTRQKLPVLAAHRQAIRQGFGRGAYVLQDPDGKPPEALFIATGSEVAVALAAQKVLAAKGLPARVVSMPSWELFAAQPEEYRRQVLPARLTARLAIEAGSPAGWERWVGERGGVLGQEGFGASAPAKALAPHFGFTAEEAARRLEELLR